MNVLLSKNAVKGMKDKTQTKKKYLPITYMGKDWEPEYIKNSQISTI